MRNPCTAIVESSRWIRRLPLFGLVLAILGMAGTAALAEADSHAKAGEAMYHQYCGACHGISGDGKGAVSSILDPRPADLTRIAARHGGTFPDAAIVRIIDGRDPVVGHGTREMPVWGRRFGEGHLPGPAKEHTVQGDIQAIVMYLKSIQVPGEE